MWACCWVWKAIAVYDLWVILGWGPGVPWQGRVWEIHVVEPKLFLITHCPLEVVHQCPRSVAPYVNTVEHDRCRQEQREERTGQWLPLSQPGQEGAPEDPHMAHSEVYCHLGLIGSVLPIPTSLLCLTWFSRFEVAQLPSYRQQAARVVHSVPRTGHCFSLLQKSKLLCKKQRVRNREENPVKCNHCLNKCLCGLAVCYKAINAWTPGCSQYTGKANWKSPFLKLFDHCCNWNQFGGWVFTVVFKKMQFLDTAVVRLKGV